MHKRCLSMLAHIIVERPSLSGSLPLTAGKKRNHAGPDADEQPLVGKKIGIRITDGQNSDRPRTFHAEFASGLRRRDLLWRDNPLRPAPCIKEAKTTANNDRSDC